jgi:hypothetical protein
MACEQGQHDRRLIVGIEVGPVHGDLDALTRSDTRRPVRELAETGSWTRVGAVRARRHAIGPAGNPVSGLRR